MQLHISEKPCIFLADATYFCPPLTFHLSLSLSLSLLFASQIPLYCTAADDEAQDLVNTAEHILRSQDALHAAAERLAKDNTELREYVRLLLPVALKEEARDAQAEAAKVRHGEEDDMEKESLMLEYEMALGECKELNKKVR